jgi:hypothetical protein
VGTRLSNFGTLNLGSGFTTYTLPDCTKIGKHAGYVGSLASVKGGKVDEVQMNGGSSYCTNMIASALSLSGSSFTVSSAPYSC